MRTTILLAGLMLAAGCTPSSITNTLAADEDGISMRKTGSNMERAEAAARAHCEDYGKDAVLVSFVGYKIEYRCAERS